MSEWISVEERLPEAEWICPDTGYKCGCVLVSDGGDVWEEYIEILPLAVDTDEVTHWMPLPEPPK